ncbi:MFS transporter [Brevibacterium sp. 50QC2O2]|jgi:sugar phosphate permease|uniref:MFS transporter n=1 Tax=Brevibacterium sp. 50QC2O2 TaxID=2968459 RepID=UPI00211BD95B|nr:MFS transporter [Brevibacterium sp. 50QC2O2]MCQ9388204.1 MFS transporter [Brevibacterium sp. 50QC2O2]
MSSPDALRNASVVKGEEHYTPAVKTATRKALVRLLPFLMLMYVIAFLDRTNIGFAEQSLEIHAGLSTAAYAFGAGLFFIGYAVFEVPSNLIMHKVGARWWMARIMITWGIIAACFMFVTNEPIFYLLRFLLGVAEAGFFPGVILYLTYWFPRRRRANATALFYMGLPIAQVIGGPLSGGLIELDGVGGLFGHQWMFLIEGLIAVVVGIVAIFYLTDRPKDAKWLDAKERTELTAILEAEEAEQDSEHKLSWWRALFNGRILYFCLVYFMLQIAVYGLTFFLPKQVASIAGAQVGLYVGLLTAIPWFVGLCANILSGRIADKTGSYRTITSILLAVSGVGLFVAALFDQPFVAMLGLCLAALGFCSAQPVFWNIPTSYLTGAALASSVGLINGVGNLGGFVAPNMRVWIVESTGSESMGLIVLGICPFIAAILCVGTAVFDKRDKNRRPQTAQG